MIICAQFVVCREREDSVGSIESKPRLKLDSLGISSLISTVAAARQPRAQGLLEAENLNPQTPNSQECVRPEPSFHPSVARICRQQQAATQVASSRSQLFRIYSAFSKTSFGEEIAPERSFTFLAALIYLSKSREEYQTNTIQYDIRIYAYT
mmetsp:Transcript_13760/g.26681  ORF Transcript_13760/g.26681 Transcript_13760/m.26681 type:complete len:152 (-) Transcript_13760:376-831(-)